MNSKEGRDGELENQEKYEATVLEFLEREMATVQPAQKRDEQSEELDALVTDLLKQVITEADQPKDGNKLLLDDEDELFADLSTEQKKSPVALSATPPRAAKRPEAAAPSTPPAPAAAPLLEEPETASMPEPAPEVDTGQTAPASVFAFSALPKRKLPILAAAGACVLAIIGASIYFFSGFSTRAPRQPETKIALTRAAQPAILQPDSGSIQPAAVPEVKPAALASTSKGSAVTAVPSSQIKKQAAPVTNPATAKPRPESSPAATVPPASVREEKLPSPQPTPQAPVAAPVVAAVEKPSASPVVENSAPVNPLTVERKPVPLMTATTPVAVSSNPAPQPASQPATAPVVPKPLMAAVPISQVSPVYPELAVRSRASGTIVLELQINDQGKVIKATPVDGPTIFYEAAVSAAMRWRYRPASIGGVNVASQSKVTMVFNLKR